MTTFTTGGSAVTFTTSGSAVSFAVTDAANAFSTSAVLTPGAHASTHGAGGSDPITTLGAVAHSGQQTFAAGSASGPSIAFTGDQDTGIYSPGADQFGVATAGTARLTIGADGRILSGLSSPVRGASLHIAGTDSAPNATISQRRYSDSTSAAYLYLEKARGSIASPSIVSSGDGLGGVGFTGYDGSAWREAASITAEVDGAPGATDMPGRLMFWTTPDAAAVPTEKLRISSNGQITTGLGSAGTPVLSFTGDTNTGIYSPGADQVGIATAGTARVYVASNGDVGIGTTSPGSYDANANNLVIAEAANAGISIVSTVSGLCSIHFADGTSGAEPYVGFVRYDHTDNSYSTWVNATERMRIDNAGLITGTGTSLGAWTSYTPALTASGSNPTLGTGSSATGVYCQVGKIVHWKARIAFGSSGTNAGSGVYAVSLPVSAKETSRIAGHGFLIDASAGAVQNVGLFINTATTVEMYGNGGTSYSAAVDSADPWAWDASDSITIQGTYEAA